MKADTVIYCDTKGQEHEALVFAVNPMNPSYRSLVYVDEAKPESDNVVKVFDVRHMDEIQEPNPALPTYHLNCWKERWSASNPLPADHPAYDHPHLRTTDEDGKPIPVARPLRDAEIAAHQAATGYDPSSEGEPAAEAPVEAPVEVPRLTEDERISVLEARVAELKAQLAGTTEGKDEALQSLADSTARPSIVPFPKAQPSPADLDAVAAEQKAAEATSGSGIPLADPSQPSS